MGKLKSSITIVLISLTTMCIAQSNDWYKLEKKEFGFRITFPKKPKTLIWNADPKNGLDYKMYRFFSTSKNKNNHYACFLFYSEYPDSLYNSDNINKDTLKNLYNLVVERELDKSPGGKLSSEKLINFKGYNGREVKIEGDTEVILMRVFLIKNNLYIMGVYTDVNPQIDFTLLTNHFFDSFELLYL